jgi:predicted permease
VLGFSTLVALATGLAIGLLPALQAGRQDLSGAMKTGAREGGVPRSGVRAVLTVVQAAFSLVLLVGAGLFVHSLWNIRNLHMGIEPDRVLAASPDWPGLGGLAPEQRAAERARRAEVDRAALAALRANVLVEAASIAVGTPFQTSFGVDLSVPGRDSIPRLPGGGPYISAVSDNYFRTVGTRLLQGRAFTPQDRADSEPVVIVNETMARALWPGEDPLSQCLLIAEEERGAPPPCARVVGVVEEARRFGLREPPAMQYYVPLGQEVGFGGSTLLVRPRGSARDLAEVVRGELRALAPDARLINVTTLQELVDPQIRPWRLGASMFLIFGLLALTIAAVGLYSLVAYGVAQRRPEIGIRMALGARAGDVVRLMMREGLSLVLGGLALGSLLALAGGRFIEPLLFETPARDAVSFGASAAVLLLAAVLASIVPAARAGRVDPAEALRTE